VGGGKPVSQKEAGSEIGWGVLGEGEPYRFFGKKKKSVKRKKRQSCNSRRDPRFLFLYVPKTGPLKGDARGERGKTEQKGGICE